MIQKLSRLNDAQIELRSRIRACGSLLVAYSGGVDSGLLAYVAHEVLGDRMRAVIGISGSLPDREEKAAMEFLRFHRIPWERLETHEMDNENYRRNHADRCYFCKAELFDGLSKMAERDDYSHIAYGANLDDQGDHRPGSLAAAEYKVVTPLVAAEFTKTMVRDLARELGLSLWDKPAAPCLASRIPYFQEVTPAKLVQIESAENVLKDLGFAVCRVRHYGEVARIEIPSDRHSEVRDPELWGRIEADIRSAGFERVELEPTGFRSGRLTEVLTRRGGERGDGGTG